MHVSNTDRSVAFYDSVAPSYDEQLAVLPGDRWARDAFRELVVEAVSPPGPLLDFGCGTGTDALWYAQHGYTVMAYDNSAGMIAELRTKCAAEIDRGTIIPYQADYAAFLKTFGGFPPPMAVTANFAVLNLIPDLAPLFAALAAHLPVGGFLILSLLNPQYWKEMIRRSWWRNQVRWLGRPYVHVAGVETDTYRHRLYAVREAARGRFTQESVASVGALIRWGRGRRDWSNARSAGERLERLLWKRFPVRDLGRYVFVVLRKSA